MLRQQHPHIYHGLKSFFIVRLYMATGAFNDVVMPIFINIQMCTMEGV